MTAPIDFEALRALAEKATPGPWSADSCGITDWKQDECSYTMEWISNGGPEDVADNSDNDKAYLAAVDPQTVLALIAERAELVAQVKHYRGNGHQQAIRAGHAETRNAELVAQRDGLAGALRPFADVAPSSFNAADGSEREEYIVLLRGHYGNPVAFTGEDLAKARAALSTLTTTTTEA